MENLQTVRRVTNQLATGKGNEKITWHLTNQNKLEKSVVHSRNQAQYASFTGKEKAAMGFAVVALPALEKGTRVGHNSALYDGTSGLAPFFCRMMAQEEGENTLGKMVVNKVGEDKTEILERSIASIVKKRGTGVPLGFNYSEINVFLPAPKDRGDYTANFAFLLTSAPQTHYQAELVIDNWLVSNSGYVVPYYPITQLMDYSKPSDLHYLSATPVAQMNRIEMAGATPSCNQATIILTPITYREEITEPLKKPFRIEGRGANGRGEASKSFQITEGKIGTGASSGMQSTTVQATDDPTRNGFVFLVNVYSVIMDSAIETIGQVVQLAIGK